MDEKWSERVGALEPKSGTLYSTFEPKKLPFKIEYDEELIKLLTESTLSVGNLSGLGRKLPNPHILIAPYLKREAVLSSRIEGTKTSLPELFISEKETKVDRLDIREVSNYIRSLEFGLNEIVENDITESLIKEMHRVLMRGVRGNLKNPGRYKTIQNWIGNSSDILDARFIPCKPESVKPLIENLIYYVNEYGISSPLIKSAVMHYQFETIHPFRDGNGRMGRLLVVLYFCKSGLLTKPLLYLSAYFEKNRNEYNEKLLRVSKYGELEEWLKFFLKGVKTQADDAVERANSLETLREKYRKKIQENSSSTNALKVLDYLFSNPFITIPEVGEILDKGYPTAKGSVNILMDNGILREVTEGKFNIPYNAKLFVAPEIHEILTL